MLVPLASMVLAAVAPVDAAQAFRIELLALDVEGIDEAAFERALVTRLPGRARIPAGNPEARAGAQWGYVLVRPVDDGWTLALILADGRGYYREVDAHDGGEPARLVANTLANLIASVEEDAIVADAEDVVVPDAVEPEPEPEPPSEPDPTTEPDPAPPDEPDPDPQPPQRAELGLRLGGLALWSAGPPRPVGFASAGPELDVSARFPRGLIVGGGVGTVLARAADYRLTRLRVAAHVGHGLRRGHFELLSLVGIRVEPWFVHADGSAASLRAGQRDASASTVAGGFLQLSPGVLVTAGALRLRIGPTLRVSGASALGNGGGVARVLRETPSGPEALFRLGGLELETGVDLTVWRPVAGARR